MNNRICHLSGKVCAKKPCHFYDVVEYSSSRDTWEKDREYCQSNGGDLIMIDNPREDHRIQKFLEDVKNSKEAIIFL